MRHVIVMTAATSVGLMAIFIVDLLSLLYVSWLGDPKLTAAVGFASAKFCFFRFRSTLAFRSRPAPSFRARMARAIETAQGGLRHLALFMSF